MKSSPIREVFSGMSRTLRVVIVLLILTLLISITFFVRDITRVRHNGMHPHNPLGIIFSGSRQPRSPVTLTDVDSIQAWMTFAYIDFSFHLEKNLLKESLHIDSPRYPNISLQSYAKENGIDRATLLDEVKNTVRSVVSGESFLIPDEISK